MGKIYARAIHNGKKTLDDVPTRYVEETKKAYESLKQDSNIQNVNIDINIIAIKIPIRHIFCFGFKFLKKDLILFILYTPYSWYNYNTNFRIYKKKQINSVS